MPFNDNQMQVSNNDITVDAAGMRLNCSDLEVNEFEITVNGRVMTATCYAMTVNANDMTDKIPSLWNWPPM